MISCVFSNYFSLILLVSQGRLRDVSMVYWFCLVFIQNALRFQNIDINVADRPIKPIHKKDTSRKMAQAVGRKTNQNSIINKMKGICIVTMVSFLICAHSSNCRRTNWEKWKGIQSCRIWFHANQHRIFKEHVAWIDQYRTASMYLSSITFIHCFSSHSGIDSYSTRIFNGFGINLIDGTGKFSRLLTRKRREKKTFRFDENENKNILARVYVCIALCILPGNGIFWCVFKARSLWNMVNEVLYVLLDNVTTSNQSQLDEHA